MKKFLAYILATASLFFAVSATAATEMSVYYALYDNELNSHNPQTVYSSGSYINVGHRSTYGDEIMRWIGKFNTDKIDPNSIQKAVVKIDRASNSWDSNVHGYGLYQITSSWDTNTATHSNAPSFSEATINGVQGSNGVFEFDVTHIVKSWMSGTANNGFVLKKIEDQNIVGNEYGQFASADYPANGSESRPVLEVMWTTAVQSVPIITSISPSTAMANETVTIY